MEGGFGRPPPSPPPPHRRSSHGKRTHSQMEAGHRRSPSPLFVRSDASSSTSSSNGVTPPRRQDNLRLLLPGLSPRHPQARVVGDGFDYRRPISSMSNNSANHVIDLTDDDDLMTSAYATPQPEPSTHDAPQQPQRLPRFGREIIDLSADTSPPEPRHNQLPQPQPQPLYDRHAQQPLNIPAIPSSPEVQFVSARPSRLVERHPTPYRQNHDAPAQPLLDLTIDLDDDVVHVRTAERAAGLNMTGPQGGNNMGLLNGLGMGRLVNYIRRAGNGEWGEDGAGAGAGARAVAGARAGAHWPNLHHFFALDHDFLDDGNHDDDVEPVPPPAGRRAHRAAHGHANFPIARLARRAGVPMAMDYTAIAFGVPLTADDEGEQRPPTPKYSPPPDPAPGFTRSPQEDDELICPNCKEELGVGETDMKKQVWIVKACGHVYCGDCMINRKSKAKGKGKARATDPVLPPPFSHCRAPGCEKTCNKNQVMQIFL